MAYARPMFKRAGFALAFMFAGVGLLAGCANQPQQAEPLAYDEALLDGELLFGATVAPAPAEDLIGVTPQMRQYVARTVNPDSVPLGRFRQLMSGMVRDGFFVDQYDRSATYDAATTFDRRKGNCLSYTNLFVALAREAGLDAQFQLVHGAPSWNVLGGFLVRNNHVNVVIRRINLPGQPRSEITVDFNDIRLDEDLRSSRISDAHGASLHYANVSVDHMYSKDRRQAFAYLKRAIVTYPENPDLWINLGALYSMAGLNAQAEAAQRVALRIDPNNKTAIAGLANSLSEQGKIEEAAKFLDRAERYQSRNAYYHYALAQRAYASENFEAALQAVDEAIRLKRNNASFYALRAATAEQLGDEQLVAQSVRQHDKLRQRAQERATTLRPMLNPGRGG